MAHSAQMACKMALDNEIHEHGLFQDRQVCIDEFAHGLEVVDQMMRQVALWRQIPMKTIRFELLPRVHN